MNLEELDVVKRSLGRAQRHAKELWLEKRLLETLVIDSGLRTEADLRTQLAAARLLPENRLLMEEQFSSVDQAIAEIGLSDWLQALDRMYPRNE